MKITALVENTSHCELKAKHGLSLYIQTMAHNILFDLGSDDTLFQNAKLCGIDLSAVDTVIISHGHNDHGGALRQFLTINNKAKVYLQRSAFEPHYVSALGMKVYVGLDKDLIDYPQIVLVDGDYIIDNELRLFVVQTPDKFYSTANSSLFDSEGKDKFAHEQNLVVKESGDGAAVLIIGCGHKGVINILDKAREYSPSVCIGGYHLYNPVSKRTVNKKLLRDIAHEMVKYTNMTFYTCHCTGKKAFEYLAKSVKNLHYLSCGEVVEI